MGAILDEAGGPARHRRTFTPIVPRPRRVADPSTSGDPAVFEGYARLMEDSGLFRVLRRLPSRAHAPIIRAPGARLALFVDVETTGPDPGVDEVIEFAVVPFSYSPAGRVIAVHEPVCQLREPAKPISPRVTRSTGLDAEALRGRVVDEAPLLPLIAEATLAVAHHAAWDRPFVERLIPGFVHLPWACSMSQLPWKGEDVPGQGLSAIASGLGFFYDEHRAVDDCLAAIEILGRPLPRAGVPAMAELLRNATRETLRVWALNSPYEAREVLRRRGYQWSSGDDGRMRAWVVEVEETALDAELAFLRERVFGGAETDVPVTRVSAYERFSARG